MAPKCTYVESVGAFYYVRKRILVPGTGTAESEVVRMSLRTKDRVTAIIRGLEALAVFEELRYGDETVPLPLLPASYSGSEFSHSVRAH